MIREKVTLAFDPKKASRGIQEVFSYPLARTLWLATRGGHIQSQYFEVDCILYARAIERVKEEGSLTAQQLFRILSGVVPPGRRIIGTDELELAADLLPFVNGEKEITFTVDERNLTEEEAFRERLSSLGPGKPG